MSRRPGRPPKQPPKRTVSIASVCRVLQREITLIKAQHVDDRSRGQVEGLFFAITYLRNQQ